MKDQQRILRRATAALLLASTPALAATVRFDNGGGDNLWENPLNWNTVGVGDGIPTTADIADIGSIFTANVSSAQTVLEIHVAHPDSDSSYVEGTSNLNILAGANVQATSSNGIRVGRKVRSGQAVGSSKGIVTQTGGTLQVNTGTNGLRLSQADGGIVADSLYAISGGSVRGGPTNGSMTAPLQVGSISTSFTRAEFRMIGSSITEARFEDVRVQGSTTGPAVLGFVLDAGGVTPLVAEDELRFVGTNQNLLEVTLSALAPESDITLITADRLNTASSAPGEFFTGLPDGAALSATFDIIKYNWTIDYQDGSDDGVLDAYVKLVFVSTEIVPEPTILSLAGIAGLGLLRRRR